MTGQLITKLKQLPTKPGVYVFKDAGGAVLYVGKAINLNKRVRSYFSKERHPPRLTHGWEDAPPRIQQMIARISDLDYTVTDNEHESLMLENNFIKQLRPKYNVLLRDDKNYQFLKISAEGGNNSIPTVGFERTTSDRQARYFGPYTSGLALKATLRLLRKIFPYCANKKIGTRPCFYYHLGRCPGACIGKISPGDYRKNYINRIMQFLAGRQTEILEDLKRQMKTLAAGKKFEQAAKVRDQIFALHRVLERQKIVYPKKISQDVFSVHQETSVACVNLFVIREGKLIRKENFLLENTKGLEVGEILGEFLPKFYAAAGDWPREIVAPVMPTTKGAFAIIESPRAKAPFVKVPSRGRKLQLIKLGERNAQAYLESITDNPPAGGLEEARLLAALKELQRVLGLKKLPGRIECYDISNIQGRFAVGSMVVFDYGHPKKQHYRKFKIKLKQTPDDYAMMREMLERRFAKSLPMTSPNPSLKGGELWPLPDLIIIDGGKGQLNAALSVLQTTHYSLPTIGLAKRLEEIYTPLRLSPFTLPSNSPALFLLQRIRDEAHRFAITYHRRLRSKTARASALDQIGAVGPAKKRLLLRQFGSVARVRQATLGELAQVVGNALAAKIKAAL